MAWVIGGQRELGAANCGQCGGPDCTGPVPPTLRMQHIGYRSFGLRQSDISMAGFGVGAVRSASRNEGPDTLHTRHLMPRYK